MTTTAAEPLTVGDRVWLVPRTPSAPYIAHTRPAARIEAVHPTGQELATRYTVQLIETGERIESVHEDNVARTKPRRPRTGRRPTAPSRSGSVHDVPLFGLSLDDEREHIPPRTGGEPASSTKKSAGPPHPATPHQEGEVAP
jgi:hypothetical protein